VGPRRESSPVVIAQSQAPPTQLLPQDAVLFHQIADGIPLLPL
jgi:hypothetical protein